MGWMLDWRTASLAFFAYTALVALTPRTPAGQRGRALAGSIAGLAVAALTIFLPHTPIAHDWLVPPSLLLLAYWSSGLLFVAPSAAQERWLIGLDRILRAPAIARRVPAPLAALLELAYVGVYPLVAVAFLIYLASSPSRDASTFWTVVLVTDYLCFAPLPWIQTRPPRALEGQPPWQSPFRQLNLHLLRTTSIQVNTFPSGHAAEALAAALLTLAAPWPIVVFMFAAALAVSAGAVLGRYHYAADAIAGWLVVILVWSQLG